MFPELTSEYFESVGITVDQPKDGHRYGGESIELANFCCVGGDVVELGSGCGVISLILAAGNHQHSIVAVEIQETLHNIALKNVEQNNLSKIVTCVNADFRTYARRHPSSADVVVSNPPFYALNSGRMSKNILRANARHEVHGTIDDLIVAAKLLLRPKGKLFLVFLKSRQYELLKSAEKNHFKISRMSEMNAKPYFLVELETLSS